MRSAKSIWLKVIYWVLGLHVIVGIIAFVAFQVSPWPAVLLIRYSFDKGGAAIAASLQKHVPNNVTAIIDERYDSGEAALLDVYFPSQGPHFGNTLRTVVWVHGGGFVAGDKREIAGYLRILASKGFTVVGINYALAPENRYPTPLRQLDAALVYLTQNATRLHVDPNFVLAGDSAGSLIAAQFAAMVASPSYARQVGFKPRVERPMLLGTLLYCGPFDFTTVNIEGAFGVLLKAMPWAYTGEKHFVDDPALAALSVTKFVTADFPPTFLSVGNGDRLAPQSLALTEALRAQGVKVDSLFFPTDRQPALPHEYQFNLDTAAGQRALQRSVEFLRTL